MMWWCVPYFHQRLLRNKILCFEFLSPDRASNTRLHLHKNYRIFHRWVFRERGCSEYQVESKMIVGTELNKIMKLKTVPAKRAQKHFFYVAL